MRPIRIDWVHPGFSLELQSWSDDRYPISFSVELELTLIVQEYNAARVFGGPRLRLYTLEIREDRSRDNLPMYVDTEIKVIHTVAMVASAKKTGNDESPFTEFRLY